MGLREMNDMIRKMFEQITLPSFGTSDDDYKLRKPNGEYVSGKIEDHWQTFQEGWEAAVEYVKQSKGNYSDIASDGGMDSRK